MISMPFSVDTRWIQNPSSPASWMTTSGGNCFLGPAPAPGAIVAAQEGRQYHQPARSALNIFSRVPGDSEVTSHVVRLDLEETKIARRSVRIEVSVSVLSALLSMVASSALCPSLAADPIPMGSDSRTAFWKPSQKSGARRRCGTAVPFAAATANAMASSALAYLAPEPAPSGRRRAPTVHQRVRVLLAARD